MQPQKQFKVLLIGDSCIDKYVYGIMKRLNPEAPVPILDLKKTDITKGMAWNVYNNLKSFDLDVYFITNKEKIVKTRFIDDKSKKQFLRVDEDIDLEPLSYEIPKKDYNAIVISDYNKGFVTSSKLFELVYSAKCPVFIDSKKTSLPKYNCYIKVNELEYSKLSEEYENIIITRGERGAEYDNILYPTKKVETNDLIGAGDTFLAALVYGYLTQGTIEKAIPIANRAAGIAVSHPGTYVLSKKDVQDILR